MPVTHIGVRNFSHVADDTVMAWAEATRTQIQNDVTRFWNIPVPTFTRVSTAPDPGPLGDIDSFIYVVNDVTDGPRLGLGWHKFVDANDRRPIGFVLVDFTVNDGQTPSRVFSHEVLEMAIDPEMSLKTPAIDGTTYLAEVGDVLSFDAGGYIVNGVLVSGFGTPLFFHRPDLLRAGASQMFAFTRDAEGNPLDPVGGQLPARAPEEMGTMVCFLVGNDLKTVLLSAAVPVGTFPGPNAASRPAPVFSRRYRRQLPDTSIGSVILTR